MKPQLVPSWSFLAIEPLAKAVKKKHASQFAMMFADRSTLAERRASFWTLFEAAAVSMGQPLLDPVVRQHVAVQFFYALLDISDRQGMPDRDMQRWQNAVVGQVVSLESLPGHAVVHAAGAPVRSA